ncbi:hypothetical protein AJ78_07029 [Emergomyces pasteurianus Ep9510]|uniref:PAS domain-containing protein n=1 Tax=Emergomyces pasteurianus Ep9510 TaxID=1447872 RepID=A0A1J9P8V4_9EURO|nr:hypothetical protein AJ78_07029 [Emergomyces pasteurianus Ep9510]
MPELHGYTPYNLTPSRLRVLLLIFWLSLKHLATTRERVQFYFAARGTLFHPKFEAPEPPGPQLGYLTPAALIKYTSGSVEDILGYDFNEVVGRSLWDFLHPDELSFARRIHSQSVRYDMAAGLNYFQIKHKLGYWVGAECVFNVVYDVLVASTSIYQRGSRSQKRAADAPVVRRLFSPAPFDPRYNMLAYISSKFSHAPRSLSHEPRAALFLNRFTRSSNIIFATSSVAHVLGLRPVDLVSKSFYYCIEECCLREAVRCIESAKSNDTIAYLRFWFRNPLLGENETGDLLSDDGSEYEDQDEKDEMQDDNLLDSQSPFNDNNKCNITADNSAFSRQMANIQTPTNSSIGRSRIEVEAVVSCSSDGLVVVLRRAQAPIPHAFAKCSHPVYANGLFASPWGIDSTTSVPQAHSNDHPSSTAPSPGHEQGELMGTIRDVAVLAWAVVGTNSSLKLYGQGNPTGESQPPDGSSCSDSSSDED